MWRSTLLESFCILSKSQTRSGLCITFLHCRCVYFSLLIKVQILEQTSNFPPYLVTATHAVFRAVLFRLQDLLNSGTLHLNYKKKKKAEKEKEKCNLRIVIDILDMQMIKNQQQSFPGLMTPSG